MKHEGSRARQWSRLSTLIAERMGLHFPPERLADLERGVSNAARELGLPDTDAYVRHLLASRIDTRQLQVLARHLTVGETYFLRDGQLLDSMAGKVLPELVEARRGRDQRLRLWSAGCSSGEEAYSLAILLHRLLPDLADWRITILATDINPAALDKARAGVYGEWSFRNVPAGLKQAYFERQPDGRHAIAARIRKLVMFEHRNLVHDVYSTVQADTDAMDVIFCRNVLMYFTPPQTARVLRRLHARLREGGWLAVGPSETGQAVLRQFEAVNFPGAILYRKRATSAVVTPPPMPALPPHTAPGAISAAPQVPPKHSRPAPSAAQAAARRARTLADRGELVEALAWCDRWIASDRLDSAAHYLRAMVLIEQGERDGARAALRRAIYLEPGFVLAHFALGNLALGEQRTDDAERHFANVNRLLQPCRPGDLVPHGDGLSAGSLAHMLASTRTGEASA